MSKNFSILRIVICVCLLALLLVACNSHNCVYNQEVVSESYLCADANCTQGATYYFSCECGNKGTETFVVGEPKEHSLVLSEDGLSRNCECGYSTDCVVDVDVLLEAENAILNTKNLSIDPDAHGGAYGLAFDNCGQGMYYRYYAYEAGERVVDVVYATGSDYAYMNMYVNGKEPVRVDYPDVEGWFGDYKIMSTVSVTINVDQGWNEIYLIKDGTAADDYGRYCQVDYILIHGTQKEYTGQEFDKTVYSYRLEAELGNYHYASNSTVPAPWGEKFSMGYGLGAMDTDGDGVKITYVARSTGTYKLRIAFGQGTDVSVNVYVNDVLINKDQNLTNESTGWDDIKLDNSGLTINLVEGEEFVIDLQRNGNWYVVDYILLELVTNN